MSEVMFLILVLVSIAIVGVKCDPNDVDTRHTLEEVSTDYFFIIRFFFKFYLIILLGFLTRR